MTILAKMIESTGHDDGKTLFTGMDVGPFEELLLPPAAVRGQADPDGGCGPACVEMLLALEAGADPQPPGQDQASLTAQCRHFTRQEEPPDPFFWAASPTTLHQVINAHSTAWHPGAARRRRYHIVHAASPKGPLEEALTWLRGRPSTDGRTALPSCLLMRHGTHWMLAVGACVEADRLVWLAAADPATGRLLCLTPAGLAKTFTPNTVGKHPDWTGRHVAVIPSVLTRRSFAATDRLPRPCAESSDPIAAPPAAVAPADAPLLDRCAGVLPDAVARPLLGHLAALATQARHPLTARWLAPLVDARVIVNKDTPAGKTGAPGDQATRRAWAVDGSGRPVADLRYRGTPAVLLQLSLVVPEAQPLAR